MIENEMQGGDRTSRPAGWANLVETSLSLREGRTGTPASLASLHPYQHADRPINPLNPLTTPYVLLSSSTYRMLQVYRIDNASFGKCRGGATQVLAAQRAAICRIFSKSCARPIRSVRDGGD